AAYSWSLVETVPGEGYQQFVLRMNSQTWRTAAEVDQPLWKHWLTIYVPQNAKATTGLLFIGGGSKSEQTPLKPDPFLVEMAKVTGSVVASLRDIPNEPLTFKQEGKPRTEDEIIAYTWRKYLETGDEKWPLRLPMTKAVVRAMDTITAFCGGGPAGGIKVDRFFVAGASKRGWTTWTTAAVDDRVIGVAPVVIDLLNIVPSFQHHYRAYGFWAPAIKDYQDMGIMQATDTGEYRNLMRLVEPYSYRDRYKFPKYIVNSSGDQFFLPDSSQFYFDDLPGEKYIRYVPNTDHSLKDSDAREGLIAYYDALLRDVPRPRFSWTFERDGSLRVITRDQPSDVKVWYATNPKARDFRLETIGKAYQAARPQLLRPGTYVARVPKPEAGWTAFFVELTFPSGGKYPFKFSTPVRVIPDTLPYEWPPKKAASAKAR
ncbi:MAG TPA: PhoPQ-activated pathogenicity-related family protein, partial [Bryobacteraceae bacterium]|nr:PhoPQ-activated pathogenicity-related family protein [Bryobacteraceae bacterium]